VPSELVLKLHEGRPNIVDAIENKKIQLVFNVPVGRKGKAVHHISRGGCGNGRGDMCCYQERDHSEVAAGVSSGSGVRWAWGGGVAF